MPMFQRPRLARHEIAARLRQQIVSGELTPGQRIRQEEFATKYGTSQGPVREAFRTLAGEGLLTHETNRGYRVVPLLRNDVDEVYLLREMLETEALRLAVPTLDDDALVELRRLAATADATATSAGDDHEGCEDAHDAFHLALFEHSGSERLLIMLRTQWAHSRRIRAVVQRRAPTSRADRAAAHDALLVACAARDVDAALRAMDDERAAEEQAVAAALDPTQALTPQS